MFVLLTALLQLVLVVTSFVWSFVSFVATSSIIGSALEQKFTKSVLCILCAILEVHAKMTMTRLKTVVEADFSYLIDCDRQRTFCCTPLFAPFCIPLLLEKLSSSLRRAKVGASPPTTYDCNMESP